MKYDNKEDVLLIALMVVTKDVVLACADELGIPEDDIDEEVMRNVKKKINQVFGDCRNTIQDVIIGTLQKEIGETEISICPLSLTCYPSCTFMTEGECQLPKKVGH
ncbi:hypothetical protein ACFLYN_00430 [Chloroflexota bacterium]